MVVENCQPREHFTAELHEMLERLDQCNSRDVEWTDIPPFREKRVANVTILKVWVFGAYARGALDCGELDLMIQAQVTPITAAGNDRALGGIASWIPTSALTSAFFGKRDVRAHLGTPADHPAKMIDTRDTLVWAGEGFDWRAAVASIKPDPNATHFARLIDALPIRTEQLDIPGGDFEQIVEAELAGLIKWAFTELPEPLAEGDLSEADKHFLWLARDRGQKTIELAPHVLAFMRQRMRWFGQETHWDGNWVDWGGCELRLGFPRFSLWEFDRLEIFEIDVVPYISRRGPNGIWSIARGPTHPIVRRLAGKAFFVSPYGDDGDILCEYWGDGPPGYGLELFTSGEHALANARGRGDRKPGTLRIQNDELLALLASADVLTLDGKEMSLTHRGAELMGQERKDDQEVILEAIATAPERTFVKLK